MHEAVRMLASESGSEWSNCCTGGPAYEFLCMTELAHSHVAPALQCHCIGHTGGLRDSVAVSDVASASSSVAHSHAVMLRGAA